MSSLHNVHYANCLAGGVKSAGGRGGDLGRCLIEDLGAEVATPAEAREILDLRVQTPTALGADL